MADYQKRQANQKMQKLSDKAIAELHKDPLASRKGRLSRWDCRSSTPTTFSPAIPSRGSERQKNSMMPWRRSAKARSRRVR